MKVEDADTFELTGQPLKLLRPKDIAAEILGEVGAMTSENHGTAKNFQLK
jgi:hypothetical protein